MSSTKSMTLKTSKTKKKRSAYLILFLYFNSGYKNEMFKLIIILRRVGFSKKRSSYNNKLIRFNCLPALPMLS